MSAASIRLILFAPVSVLAVATTGVAGLPPSPRHAAVAPDHEVPAAAPAAVPRRLDDAAVLTPTTPVDATSALRKWAEASRAVGSAPGLLPTRLAYERPDLSGHRVAFAATCGGPIDAAELSASGTWGLIEGPHAVVLTYEPHDPLAKHLTGTASVVLDPATWLPREIAFADSITGKPDGPSGIDAGVVTVGLDVAATLGPDPVASGVRVASAEAPTKTGPSPETLPLPPPPAD